MKSLLSLTLSMCLALVNPVSAQAGDPLNELVQIEVLDGGVTPDGTYMSALRLTLQDGWKTYWRAPGDTGIPPQFSWQGSRNIDGISITWPTPQVFDTNGYRTIGYLDQLVLPIEITPKADGKPVRLRGRVDLGLCKDVCIPGQVDFDHQLDFHADRNPAIAAAMAQRPYSAKEAGVTSATCRIKPTKDGLQVEARIALPATGGTEVAVIESGNPQLWATQTVTRRQSGVLIAASELVSVNSASATSVDRSQLRITVLGQNHAVDIQGCTG